jgi:hypothetical protein
MAEELESFVGNDQLVFVHTVLHSFQCYLSGTVCCVTYNLRFGAWKDPKFPIESTDVIKLPIVDFTF